MATVRRPSKSLPRWSKLKEQQAKQAAEPPPISQRTLDRVTKERDDLKKKLDASLKHMTELKRTIRNIAKKAMDVANPTPFLTGSEKDPSDMTEEEVIEMIGKLVPAEKNESFESRIEELETRITLLSGELGKLFKLKLNLEDGLNELSSCQDLNTMRDTVKQLRYQSIATKLFAGDSLKLDGLEEEEKSRDSPSSDRSKHMGIPSQVQINLEPVDIPPSKTRKAPDTHIKNMQPELRQLVIQELSLYKGSGSDWRMFAQRVGVPDSLIEQWQQMKVHQPMRNALGVWAASPGATVRILHRHLVSPQMRCVLLAKRVSDYYQVD
ncbi:centrosomal protein of 128 kDa-like [Littorina saxatilis]|uniref:Death domain-containing protein n=1 Tax=Littorina saxatilis TaxID=31220 RepID=A0AAN9BCW8_9CAEN